MLLTVFSKDDSAHHFEEMNSILMQTELFLFVYPLQFLKHRMMEHAVINLKRGG